MENGIPSTMPGPVLWLYTNYTAVGGILHVNACAEWLLSRVGVISRVWQIRYTLAIHSRFGYMFDVMFGNFATL